jgi:transcription elongation regulator 1
MQTQPPLTVSQGNITFDVTGNMVNISKQRSMVDLEAEKERKRKEDEKAKQAAKPQDKSRPISSTPISGTPWCAL